MIPIKYKKRKLQKIFVRNLKEQHNYFIKVRSKGIEPIQSRISDFTSNPVFEINNSDPSFCEGINSLTDFEMQIEVYKSEQPDVAIQCHEVDLTQLQFVFHKLENQKGNLGISLLLCFTDGFYLNSKDAAIYFLHYSGVDTQETVDLVELPLKLYAEKLCIFRDKIKIHKELNSSIVNLEKETSEKIGRYNKAYELVLEKRRREMAIDVDSKVLQAGESLARKQALLCKIGDNLKEKKKQIGFFFHIFAAFEEDLNKSEKALAMDKGRLEIFQKIYVARKIKILFLLGYIFFNDKTSKIFKKFGKLTEMHATSEKTDQKISNGLGYVALLAIILSKYINVSLTYTIVYGGPRSVIRKDQGEDLPLFLPNKSERPKFLKGINLLVQNFLQIITYCSIKFIPQKKEAVEMLPEILNCLSNYLSHFFLE